MNLLMIILIVLGLWVGSAVCYFAWRLMEGAEAEKPASAPPESNAAPGAGEKPDAGGGTP